MACSSACCQISGRSGHRNRVENLDQRFLRNQDGLAHNRLCFGTIERGSDAWEIMRDAGRFLKNPMLTGLPAGANQPMAVGAVIGTGYSQTGAGQRVHD